MKKCSVCGGRGHNKRTCDEDPERAKLALAFETIQKHLTGLRAGRRIADPNSPVYLRAECGDKVFTLVAVDETDALDLSDELERQVVAIRTEKVRLKKPRAKERAN